MSHSHLPKARFIPIEATFRAGGEVVRGDIHFKTWVGYRVTKHDDDPPHSKRIVKVAADDGSEFWIIYGASVAYAKSKLRECGVKVVD